MDGIVIVNKPQGVTSHDVVYKVRKIFNEKKVGHTGTLDPLATGVLPLLIGKATLCSKYLIEHDKIYEVGLCLGKKTDTADAEGEVIETKNVDISCLEIDKIKIALKSFLGKQKQVPPMYSAIKVKGKKLYEYARNGEKLEVEPRDIEIFSIDLKRINLEENQIDFIVHCSKGTYIRSLCEDIATKLGNIGYMQSLKRIKVGKFSIEDAISLEELEIKKNLRENIISLEDFFSEKEKILLDKKGLKLFLNGVQFTRNMQDGIYRIYCENSFIGTGVIKEKLLKRDIIVYF